MRVPTKIRKAVKWLATVLAVLLLTAWIGSAWWGVSRIDVDASRNATAWYVAAGQVRYTHLGTTWAAPVPMRFSRTTSPFDLGWDVGDIFAPPILKLQVPLWWPLLPTLWIAVRAWTIDVREWRRRSRGACLACGYDLSASAANAPCPECGTRANASA